MNLSAQEAAIRPIYVQAAESMREVGSPLQAELWASELLGAVRLGVGPVPDDEMAEVTAAFVGSIAKEAERVGDATALAMLRALVGVLPKPERGEVCAAADRLAARGLPDPPWAAAVGAPSIGSCLRHADVDGEQASILVSARYGGDEHVLVVLVDEVLGGGVKDCWVTADAAEVMARFRRAGREPGMMAEILSWLQARELLTRAVSRPECPEKPDQVEDVALHWALLRARLALDDVAAVAPSVVPSAKAAARGSAPAKSSVLQLKVTLRGSKPPIWRRLQVPSTITLDELHDVIQTAFDWAGYHLHVFEVNGVQYGEPDPELEFRSEFGVRLSRVARVGSKLRYTYDFGDDWEHVIEVEKSLPAQPEVFYPRCTGGRRAAPPEDCGGVWGYEALLELWHNASDDEQADEDGMLSMLPEDFDPAVFDLDEINELLALPADEGDDD